MAAAAPRGGTSLAYRGNIWRLFAVQALLMFILWVPIWVVFLQRKGLGLTQIGLLEGFAWVLTAALEVPSGAIADRFAGSLHGHRQPLFVHRLQKVIESFPAKSLNRVLIVGGRHHEIGQGNRYGCRDHSIGRHEHGLFIVRLVQLTVRQVITIDYVSNISSTDWPPG